MLDNFRTYKIAVDFYAICQTIRCKGSLKDQLERASASIALNLAEGRGKPTIKDQKRYFHIAFGSARECQAILTLLNHKDSPAWRTLDHLAASLYRLLKNAR